MANLFSRVANKVGKTVAPAPETLPETSREDTLVTLREVCAVLGFSIPGKYKDMADTVFTEVCWTPDRARKGCLQFIHEPDEESCRKSILVALEKGASFFISPMPVKDAAGKPFPCIVNDDKTFHRANMKNRMNYVKVCAYIKQRMQLPTIVITGSVGKTTTKDMLNCVISSQFNLLCSPGNCNGLGSASHYMQKLSKDHEVYLQEAGVSKPGSLERVAEVIRPTAFIVTNIGLNHVKLFGDQQGIMREKLIFDNILPDDGKVFLNYDDPLLSTAQVKHEVISYAVNRTDVDYYAANVEEADGIISFDLVETASGFSMRGQIHAFGFHNVYNAVCAFAVGRWLGVSPENIAKGLDSYRATGLRQNYCILGGQRVFIDCYNASEVAADSSSSALESINPGPGGKRIFVFADIDYKLGEMAEEIHRRVGKMLAAKKGIDQFVFYGPHAAWAAEEAEKLGAAIFKTESRDELNAFLKENLGPEDVIGFKGGQQMQLCKTIDYLFGTMFILEDGDMLKAPYTSKVDEVEGTYRIIKDYGVEFYTFKLREPRLAVEKSRHRKLGDNMGLTDEQVAQLQEVTVPAAYDGRPVLLVGIRAFYNAPNLRKVRIEEGVRSIATLAFSRSANLESVELPSTIRVIGKSAFKGCTGLKELVIPEGVTTVDSLAFADCTNLQDIYLPGSLKTVGDLIFSHTKNVTAHCPKDSEIAKYLEKRYSRIPVEYTD